MASESAIRAEIARLEDILASGVVEDEVDGQRTKFDHASIRLTLDRLYRKLGNRPVASTVYLGGF